MRNGGGVSYTPIEYRIRCVVIMFMDSAARHVRKQTALAKLWLSGRNYQDDVLGDTALRRFFVGLMMFIVAVLA